MSVVSAVFNKTGVIMMGDTKGMTPDGSEQLINKVTKNGNKLLGFTGDTGDIIQYLYPIINENLEFAEINRIPEGQFLRYFDMLYYESIKNDRHYNIQFMVSDVIGNSHVLNIYSLFEHEIKSYSTIGTTFQILGNESHKKYLGNKLLHGVTKTYDKEFIISYFQDTLDNGIKFDNTINNIIHYEITGDFKWIQIRLYLY